MGQKNVPHLREFRLGSPPMAWLCPGRYFLELKEHTVPVGSTALTHPWAFLVRISGTSGMMVSKPPILGVSIAPYTTYKNADDWMVQMFFLPTNKPNL